MSIARDRSPHPDRIAAATTSHGPPASPSATLALLRQVARAWLGLLSDGAREAGLNQTDYLALIRIVAAEGMVPSDLRKVLGISAGSMSDLTDRLERRGLIRRVDRPEDRRSIELRATAKGVRTAEQTVGPVIRSVLETVRGLKAEELRVVHKLLGDTALALAEPPTRRVASRRPR
jgi:DNA-binding MarR family transcriptional regulator